MTNAREAYHIENAQYFTAVRGAKPETRIRLEFTHQHQAEAWAIKQFKGDGRTMLYAVSDQGAAHVKNV